VALVRPWLPNLPFALDSLFSLPQFFISALLHGPRLAVGIKPYPNCWLALWICRLKGAVAVQDVDDLDGAWRGGLSALLDRLAQAPAFLLLKQFSTHHPRIRAALAARRLDCVELEQGVELEIFRPPKPAAKKEKLLLFTAHLNVACQLELLLGCLSPWLGRNPSWSLLVAGGGPKLRAWRRRFSSGQVRFSGALEPEAVAALAAKASICVAAYGPGPANAHRVPMKLGEYLAMGKPVVSNLVEGAGALKKFLYLAEPSPASFSRQLQRLAAGRGDGREKRGEAWVRRKLDSGAVAGRFLKRLGLA
jgi:glycosyltransferase involved in cell wall biosynthesis